MRDGAYCGHSIGECDRVPLQAIGSEGGYRRIPTPIPAKGLFMGVAERYEVCDQERRAVLTQPSHAP
jgi:hypothetical protein